MSRRLIKVLFIALFVAALPFRAPAPLVYRPGEGWTYEPYGGAPNWRRARAKDQLELAQGAFDKKDYSLALRAARRVVTQWPVSDYAPQAQYLVGRCYEVKGEAEKAFKEYEKLLEKQPKIANFEEILRRQYEIAGLYLAGKWFYLYGVIPLFSNMEKTAGLYTQVVKSGPYSEVAPLAQLKIGAAREKQKDYVLAAEAYELAFDRYHDRPKIASEALFREGLAYNKQAQTAEYDQTTAGQAISTFNDFITLYPNDDRAGQAQKTITSLKAEQARGYFMIARFYERYHKWNGAVVYYNEAQLLDPTSSYATEAKQRIEALKKRTQKPGP
jgi:outer membrane protein assembly factor BamD